LTTPFWSDNPSALDLLGFADVTAPIAEAVIRDKLDPVTVGIEGDWGSGKSSILAILGKQLEDDTRSSSSRRTRGSTTPRRTPKRRSLARS